MGLIRNLLTVAGVIAVFGVVYLFVKPDWYEKLASNPASSSSVAKIPNGTLAAVYECERGVIEKERLDKGAVALSDAVESTGVGIPSKNAAYLLVIDKSNNAMRFWKLSPAVKKIVMKNANSLSVQVHVQESSVYQMEIWIDHPVNLNLQFELGEGEK